METFFIKALQLIVALAFLVFIHELGHYTFARIFGIKVEKFYLFFNPWFSLFKWKPKEKTSVDPNSDEYRPSWRSTVYGIGWLPLGGYCKIAGMIDESMDKEQMKQPPKSWEFRTKPAWQRLLVMIGGVLFNFIAAVVIYAAIAFTWGDKYIPMEEAYEGYDYVPAALEAGFQNGDIPLLADGKKIDASEAGYLMQMAEAKTITVLRNHRDTVEINLPADFIFRLNDDKGFLRLRVPVFVASLVNGEPAIKAGIKEGDHIIAVDTIPTPAFSELTPALLNYADKETTVTVVRGDSTLTLAITPNSYGKLGFKLQPPTEIFKTVTVNYGLLASFPKGWDLGTDMLTTYVGSMKHLFSREGATSIGGFGAIGDMFPAEWNWYSFWEITAFLAVALAFMNIIPIPGLDGGHILFLLYEMITRRQAPEKVMEYAQWAGMIFLLMLLLYANGADLVRAFM
ncbi:MAG: RIP metalloprotease RseP [Muribaculaceae bacterium]|nr:RIP metalloprotease RseP [Muribaculaceae bacterium]